MNENANVTVVFVIQSVLGNAMWGWLLFSRILISSYQFLIPIECTTNCCCGNRTHFWILRKYRISQLCVVFPKIKNLTLNIVVFYCLYCACLVFCLIWGLLTSPCDFEIMSTFPQLLNYRLVIVQVVFVSLFRRSR